MKSLHLALIFLFIAQFFGCGPSVADKRRSRCESFGIKDSKTLNKCGESAVEMENVIAPFISERRKERLKQGVKDFNRRLDLLNLLLSQTRIKKDEYQRIESINFLIKDHKIGAGPFFMKELQLSLTNKIIGSKYRVDGKTEGHHLLIKNAKGENEGLEINFSPLPGHEIQFIKDNCHYLCSGTFYLRIGPTGKDRQNEKTTLFEYDLLVDHVDYRKKE